jgi:hypothetical protein
VGRISKARPQTAAPAAYLERHSYCCRGGRVEVARGEASSESSADNTRPVNNVRKPCGAKFRMRAIGARSLY